MTRLLFILVFLTLQTNEIRQPRQTGGWLPYSQTDHWRYYSITSKTSGWPFCVTGVQPVDDSLKGNLESIRWFTTSRLFPQVLQSCPITLELGNKQRQERYFVQQVGDLGNGVADFWLSQEHSLVNGFVGVSQIDTAKYHLGVGFGQLPLDSAYYLPENKWYLAIGPGDLKYHASTDDSVSVEIRPDISPDIKGLIIDRVSQDSDCGSGFFYHGQLFIAVKPVYYGLMLNKKKLDQVTLAVPVQ